MYKKYLVQGNQCFVISNNHFIYYFNNEIIIENYNSSKKININNVNKLKLSSNYLIVSVDGKSKLLFDLKSFNRINLSIPNDIYIIGGQDFNNENLIVSKEISLFENILGIYDLYNKTYYLKSDFYPEIIFNNHVFGGSYFRCIISYNLKNGEILWQTDISQIGKHIPFPDEEEKEGEVKNFVGVYNNELIVQLTGGKFIGLDLENGKVNWEQNLVENNLTNQVIDYNFGDPYNPFLDEENGKIYILQGEVFIVLDLLTKKATYQWSSLNLPTEDYVFIRQSNICNNQIVFSAFRKGNIGNDDTIGVFDIKRNEIVWKHTFDFEKDNFIPNSNTNIQMSENRIGALDWKGDLYIFEREKNK
ncbi:PQQ-binding-like beta-propeller repeat protein [Flavobacterium oreochromis]|uniref:outer membrane protein assembly factor BamB family protein n=1 Tax=Flavobacterium oreochromis TaxID=2906078 RepID=UPI00385F9F92